MEYKCKSPILLRLFNRLDKTQKCIEAIRKVSPDRIFIVCDGPREEKSDDLDKVNAVRQVARTSFPNSKVSELFWDTNQGSVRAGFNGITWFFQNVDQGIILEDDHIPSIDFFKFCDLMLDRYKQSESIFAVSGNYRLPYNSNEFDSSYYFSRYFQGSGWASWAVAWDKATLEIPFWGGYKKSREWSAMLDLIQRSYWEKIFDLVYSGKKVHWDFAWVATILYYDGYVVTPTVNLVENIGFDDEATNTKCPNDPLSKFKVDSLGEIRHPDYITEEKMYDEILFHHVYGDPRFKLIKKKLGVYFLKSIIKKLFSS